MARLLDDDVAGVQLQEVVAGGEVVDERAHEGAAARVRLRGVLERGERRVVEGLVDLGGLVAQLEAGERPELERLGRRDAGVEAREPRGEKPEVLVGDDAVGKLLKKSR